VLHINNRDRLTRFKTSVVVDEYPELNANDPAMARTTFDELIKKYFKKMLSGFKEIHGTMPPFVLPEPEPTSPRSEFKYSEFKKSIVGGDPIWKGHKKEMLDDVFFLM